MVQNFIKLDLLKTPTKTGYIKLTLDKETCSIQHGKVLNEKTKENDIIWVHNVIDYEVDEKANEEIAENKKKSLNKAFD